MKKKELGITKGVAVMYPSNTNLYTSIYVGDKCVSESKYYGTNNNPAIKEGLANATLIADAFNTANKCGLLPSELLEQRDELLELLKEITTYAARAYSLTAKQCWPKWYDKAINQIER